MAEEDKKNESMTASSVDIHEDILESIVSHVPLVELLPAYNVSTDWRRAVRSSLSNPSRVKPWLIAHVQSSRNLSLVATRAYDPETQVWIDVPRAVAPLGGFSLRSSHSNLLYVLAPSKLCFSRDVLVTMWHEIEGPKFWRSDPTVAAIGSDVIVSGGTCDFEDDPLSVEVYNKESQRWEACEPMPGFLKGSAAATWLSVAVSDKKMFLLEKHTGAFCSFDPKSKTWECMPELRPNTAIFFSLIGFANNRLIFIGLLGDAQNVQTLRVWQVHAEQFNCKEIGIMPSTMLEELLDEWSLSSISISMARDMVYIYNSMLPKKIIYCELCADSCKWESVPNSVVDDRNVMMHNFVLTSSQVGIHDLQRALRLGGNTSTTP